MHRNQSVNAHNFAMIPRADIPRASFMRQSTHKTTFDAGYLVPILVDEVLPGDAFKLQTTMFARLATPIAPIMDNMYIDTFFFFVPCRLVWDNWQKFMGEQKSPGDSTDYLIPAMASPVGGYEPLSIYDYFGLPTIGQVHPAGRVPHITLPLRAYNLIYNEWFRDENLCDPKPVRTGDSGDFDTDYQLCKRGKRHDYFTSCLPWPQKGDSVSLPLGTTAPIYQEAGTFPRWAVNGQTAPGGISMGVVNGLTGVEIGNVNNVSGPITWAQGGIGLYADLSEATAATINQIRTTFQIQKLLERDARGGTRYTEIIRSHFGVISPDARLQRPEYLGGGSTAVNINPIAQTGGTGAQGTTTPQGNLAAMGTALTRSNGFTQSFTEHGYVIGLASVRADLTYQQGIRKLWSRQTRYDMYMPVFQALGEQAVLLKEIYATGISEEDNKVFGYQERWAEYRYFPSLITGLFKSTTATNIDIWHLAQHFTTPPTLGETFIIETPPVERITAVGAAAEGQQFIADIFFNIKSTRPMPLYSVPGMIDHF